MRIPAGLLAIVSGACISRPPRAPRSTTTVRPAGIIARSHAILEALDRGDEAAVRPVLGASYVHFERKVVGRGEELRALAKRTSLAPRIASRQWSHEQAFVGPASAMFIGEAREQNAGNKVHGGGYIYEGWYTLGWAPEDGAWKLIYLGWKPAGAASESASWDQIFHNAVGFNHQPNRLLTSAIAGLEPGAALDVATGQGRNALYLAAHGWKVTGIDISDEGLQKAREAARRAGLHLDLVHADARTFDFGRDRWDLVTLIYAPAVLGRIHDIQRGVRRGGLVVYEYFVPDGPNDEAPAPGELAKQFAGWDVLRDDIVEDVPDWAEDRAKLERFVARKR
jgi:SAM-dependent methyltransferase